ncbi:hypothetical protein ACFFJB_06655 [Camelimonas abortus]|uniref:Methyltransferase family protein n=1 Tax=Camelimonas abortus TaxID=1017184 RepID=A0ABV7LGI7_9HYPH
MSGCARDPVPLTEYDRQLFSHGLRKWVHEGRFHWLRRETRGLSGAVIELGCFNARSLQYLSFTPTRYLGLDAGTGGGLDEAIARYPQHEFRRSSDPADVSGRWDVALALETLEHLPRPGALEAYVARLAACAPLLLATVPVETGPLFAAKFLYKKHVYGFRADHSFRDFVNQTLGRCERVPQDGHRGFDYRALVRLLSQYYRIVRVEGVRPWLPRFLNTQIAIRAESRLFGRTSRSEPPPAGGRGA